MRTKQKQMVLEQLDRTLGQFAAMREVSLPVKGWIRAVREALGMNGTQLAQRLKVSQPRIPKIEQDELAGGLTLKTMRQVAEALDCVFVYALVPKTTLAETVQGQARKVAQARMQRVTHTMLLEAQELTDMEQQASLAAVVEELVREKPKELWDAAP
jgi:predicted DNA-binding mobile mystery protein A